MIIEETLEHLLNAHRELLSSERIEKLVVGVFFTAVQLSGGGCGIARSELDAELSGAQARHRSLGEFAPGRLGGRSVLDILRHVDDRLLFNSVKLASLNALSAHLIENGGYTVVVDRDPIEWVDASAGKNVTLVGAFPSYMDTLSQQPCSLQVIELDPDAFAPRHRRFYVPAARAGEILPHSDAVIITASTLVNNTLDDLLALVSPTAFVALVGPSGGLLPDVLFRKKIHVIGTIRILDPDTMFTVISEGGSGYHLFRSCAQKVCVIED